MGAANGFVTTEPDATYGASDIGTYSGTAYAQKFTCGGSGAQEASVIGVYGSDPLNADDNIKLAIFTDDAGNSCPGDLVANSEAVIANTSGVTGQLRYEYVTKPSLTGGSDYWIAILAESTCYAHGNTTGGTSVEKAATYPTLPDGNGWHSPSSSTADYSFYAVYAAAPSTSQYARPSSDVSDGTWTNQNDSNVNLYDNINEETASDLDYIKSAASPSNDTCTMTLSSMDPPSAGTVTLRVRAKYV